MWYTIRENVIVFAGKFNKYVSMKNHIGREKAVKAFEIEDINFV